MSRGTLLGLLAVVLALAGSAVAQQGSPYGAEYQTCRTADNTLRYIGQDPAATCGAGETKVVLRGRGATGPAGPRGPAGAEGQTGTDCLAVPPGGVFVLADLQLTTPFCRGASGGGVIDRNGFIASSGATRRRGTTKAIAAGNESSASAACEAGELLLSGGHTLGDVDSNVSWKALAVRLSSGGSTEWTVRLNNASSEKVKLTAWAVCTKPEGPDIVFPPGYEASG